MRTVLLSLILLFPTFAFAKENEKKQALSLELCEELLGAAIFNKVLEEICGFNGGVKDKIKTIYDNGKCRYTVPQSTVEVLAKDVLEDSRLRYKAFGEKEFCDGNLKGYTDLMDVK